MHTKLRNQSIAMIGLAWILLGSYTVSLADEGDARLRKRIEELEAENRSLRKIIVEIRSALKSIPESATAASTNSDGLRIVVLPGEWGSSELRDMQKVCLSAARSIAAQLTDDGFAPIIVKRSKSGPITLYRRGEGNEHIVRLDTRDKAWAQLAFQFSHEFCHIVCNYREARNPQLWFEETMCECASLYSLRRMAEEWTTEPPYSNWKSYSASLARYADDRIKTQEDRKESVAHFYKDNLAELERKGTNRELNKYFATKLLPLFETTPAAWQSLRYLNLGPVEENVSFKTYLTGWLGRVPEQHRPFIRQIASEFDIQLTRGSKVD